jgi:hypothetical protein
VSRQRRAPAELSRRLAPRVAPPLLYLAAGIWLWHPLFPGHLASSTLVGGRLDASIFIWWLNWTPYALLHGLNPFVSNYLLAPQGVNAMQNTSVIALGVILMPVTELFGVVASYNLACILGPPLTAWTAYLWLSRHFGRLPAFVGGLTFGFSPIVIAHVSGDHLNLTVLFLVPLILMLVEDLLWRADRPWWPAGPQLGVLIAVQLLVSTEVLALTALGCIGLCLLVAAAYPRKVVSRLPRFAAGAGVAVVVATALCAWPLYEEFSTRPRLVGSPATSDAYTGRPSLLFTPPHTMIFHTAASANTARHILSSVENGLYLGIPLMVVLTVAFVARCRRRPVLVATAIALAALSVQLGWPDFIPGLGHVTPLRFLQNHFNLLALTNPSRFAILMWAAIAFVLADFLDWLCGLTAGWRRVGFGLVVLGLLPLLPESIPLIQPVKPAPAVFTSRADPVLQSGDVVMVAPMATVRDTVPMLWQVETGMTFRQVGGYMQHPGPEGVMTAEPYPPALTTLFGINSHGQPFWRTPAAQLMAVAREELAATQAVAFLVADAIPSVYECEYRLARELLGRPPDEMTAGVAIWTLGGRPRAA